MWANAKVDPENCASDDEVASMTENVQPCPRNQRKIRGKKMTYKNPVYLEMIHKACLTLLSHFVWGMQAVFEPETNRGEIKIHVVLLTPPERQAESHCVVIRKPCRGCTDVSCSLASLAEVSDQRCAKSSILSGISWCFSAVCPL